MKWAQNQKTNMQLLLEDLEDQRLLILKRRRHEKMEKRGVDHLISRSTNVRKPDEYLSNFFHKIEIGSGNNCWLWNGARNRRGYGLVTLRGVAIGSHRLSYIIQYGRFDNRLFVCHTCDNPRCCNPSHLFIGTAKDNAIDRQMKGRSNTACGERHGMKKHPERASRGILHSMAIKAGRRKLGYDSKTA